MVNGKQNIFSTCRRPIFCNHVRTLEFYLRTMKCPGQDRKLYPEFLKMNNSYDKKLIIRFGWYEKDGTDGRKYIEEDGETGLIKEISEGEFVRKHKKYVIENCITGIEGETLEVRKELYPEKQLYNG